MTKLTDTQIKVLTSALGRADGMVIRPEALNRTAVVKVAAKLLDQALVQEVPAKLGTPIWRMDDDGRAFSLKILKAGRVIVQAPGAGPKSAAEKPVAAMAVARPSAAAATKAEPAELTIAVGQCKSGSKREMVLALLQRQGGATIGDLMTATGWLPHTTRAALSGLRKRNLVLERFRDEELTTRYRIVDGTNAAIPGASDLRAEQAGAAATGGAPSTCAAG